MHFLRTTPSEVHTYKLDTSDYTDTITPGHTYKYTHFLMIKSY